MNATARQQLTNLTANTSTAALAMSLIALTVPNGPEETLVRAAIIDELTGRFPAAAEAVMDEFEAAEEAGIELDYAADYVTVLLANIPGL